MELGDNQAKGVALNNIAGLYYAWGKYIKAGETYLRSLKYYREIGYRQGEGIVLSNLGMVYHKLNNYDKAENYYQESLGIQRQLGDKRGDIITGYNLALVFEYQGKIEKAVKLMKRVVDEERITNNARLKQHIIYLDRLKQKLAEKNPS